MCWIYSSISPKAHHRCLHHPDASNFWWCSRLFIPSVHLKPLSQVSPLARSASSAYPAGYAFPFSFVAAGVRFLRHLLSTVHCSFLAVGLLPKESQLDLPRFTSLRYGWGGCLLYAGAQGVCGWTRNIAHHPMWLIVVVLVGHHPTISGDDAYEDSLAFTRPSFPWPALV
jgi:hypothetical protein